MSAEQELRDALKKVDEKRQRAKVLESIARWPMGVPSELRADKRKGWFRSIWKGTGTTVMGEVVLTREERAELSDWMYEKASRLNREADEIAESLAQPSEVSGDR